MHLEDSPLIRDFPTLQAQLSALRQKDAQFAAQTDSYVALDQRICRVEAGVELLDGGALALLALERTALKDDIARKLKGAAGSCCGGCGG